MLPFLKPRPSPGGVITTVRPSDYKEEKDHEDHALKAAAEDLKRALDDGDSKHIAMALRAAFQILDAEPHSEGEHLDEHANQEEES